MSVSSAVVRRFGYTLGTDGDPTIRENLNASNAVAIAFLPASALTPSYELLMQGIGGENKLDFQGMENAKCAPLDHLRMLSYRSFCCCC
jgi:hypothetical protein